MPQRKKRRVETPEPEEVDDASPQLEDDPAVGEDEEALAEPEASGTQPFVVASAGEAYLLGLSRKIVSSAAKLSDRVEAFTRTSYLAALKEDDDAPRRATPEDAYDRRFAAWQLELDEGFSVLLHGLGSKRALLDRFARRSLRRHGDVVVIDGFLPSLALSDVLTAIETDVLAGATAVAPSAAAAVKDGDRADQRLRSICAHFGADSRRRPLYIVVNNLDGVALSGARAKAALTVLAAQPRIHVVATIDHVRAPLLFPAGIATARRPAHIKPATANGYALNDGEEEEDDDDDAFVGELEDQDDGEAQAVAVRLARGYNFVHHHTPTFLPYTHEALASGMPSVLFPPSIFPPLAALHSNRTTSAGRVEATLGVLSAVNDKAKQAFRHLAAMTPTRYALLLSACVKDLTALDSGRLDALLFELVDHRLVEEGETEPSIAGQAKAEGDEPADDEDEDEEIEGQTSKTGWIWINLNRAEIKAVLERLDR